MSYLSTARLRRTSAVLAALALAGLSAAVLVSPPAQAAADGLELVAAKQSLLGTHYWYRQTSGGYRVLDSFYVEHVAAGGKKTVEDGRLTVGALKRTTAAVSKDSAVTAASRRTPGAVREADLVVLAGSQSTLAWSVVSNSGHGSTRTLVDAASGSVISVKSLVKHADGTGKVFAPNPVMTLQDETLTDQNDANYQKLKAAYRNVKITKLDGSGFLRGAYAYNASDANLQAFNKKNHFSYPRSHPGFEQTMAYYHITHAQEYIHSLGFTAVNSEPQHFSTTGLAADNSFYDPSVDRITFGTGGVDDAEDAEVIWHEYGHAIQDAQVPGFGENLEAGSIGEGFGDYWAYTMSSELGKNTATTPLACIGDWDATAYTDTTPHCLRRVDGNKKYPADIQNEVHADGEIWSRALLDIHKSLGRTKANKVILEAQFSFTPTITFKSAAEKTVAAAKALYGANAAAACTKAFKARSIL